jgi:serine/threonine-protein kinase RsbT
MSTERKVYINNDLDIVTARMQAREMARQLGFGTADQARISLAASELARLLAWTPDREPREIIMSSATRNGHPGIQVVCLICFDQIPGESESNEAEELLKQNRSFEGARQLVDESFIEPQDNKYARVTLVKWLTPSK